MVGTFMIEVGNTGKFRFDFPSRNHQVVLASETWRATS